MGQRFQNLLRDSPRVRLAASLVVFVLLAAFVLGVESPPLVLLAIALILFPGLMGAAVRLLGLPVLAAGISGVLWLLFFGSYSPVRDGVLLGTILTAILTAHPSWRAWFAHGCVGACPLFIGRTGVRAGVIAAVAFWIASSAADSLTRSVAASSPDSNRFQELARRPTQFESTPVALALSGGGYRAALVHAGVLFALEDLGLRIAGLSTVSGGSIIGAYYVIGGTPLRFLEIVQQRQLGLAREVTRFPTLLRLASPLRLPGLGIQLIPGEGFSRTLAQAEMLDRAVFSNLPLRALTEGQRPLLMLTASDLLSGDAIGITPYGVFVHKAGTIYERAGAESALDSMWQSEWIPPIGDSLGNKPLSRFVAASGAFPGALAAISEEFEAFHPRTKEPTPRRVLLGDGGLTDNTGITLLLTALTTSKPLFKPTENWKSWEAKLVIASDGGQQIAAVAETGLGYAQQLSRTADIVYASSGVRFVPPTYAKPPKVLVLTSSIGSFRSPDWLKDANPMGKAMLQRGPVKPGLPLADELVGALAAFRRTPTLSDVLDPEDARLLFRLGQFMVARRWTAIWYELSGSPEAYAHVRGLTSDHDAVKARIDRLRSLAPAK